MRKKVALKAVEPKAAAPSKPKILIYGKPGVGKTWASLDFPNVYYIDTEGGADLAHYTDKLEAAGGMYFGIDQGSLDFGEVIGQVEALATQKHDFKTLVIDSISEIYNLEITKEGERLGDKNGFGADKRPAIAYTRRLINWLKRIDMNVILIAHEKAEWKNGEQVGDTFDAWDKLEYQLHLCLNIIKIGPKRMYKVRKSRLKGFPEGESRPWSYTDFAEAYGQDVIEKEVTQIVLATDDQLKEINSLLSSVQLPDDWAAKCLKKEGAEALDELSTESIQKMIDYIKTKFLPTSN